MIDIDTIARFKYKKPPLISFPKTLKVFLGGDLPPPPATDRGRSGMKRGGTVLAVAAGRKTAGGGRRLVSGGKVRGALEDIHK